jgi:hypothetical protein
LLFLPQGRKSVLKYLNCLKFTKDGKKLNFDDFVEKNTGIQTYIYKIRNFLFKMDPTFVFWFTTSEMWTTILKSFFKKFLLNFCWLCQFAWKSDCFDDFVEKNTGIQTYIYKIRNFLFKMDPTSNARRRSSFSFLRMGNRCPTQNIKWTMEQW